MDIKWVDGFEIRVNIDGEAVLISANREGLLSLAEQLTMLAEQPAGSQPDQSAATDYGNLEPMARLQKSESRMRELLHVPQVCSGRPWRSHTESLRNSAGIPAYTGRKSRTGLWRRD